MSRLPSQPLDAALPARPRLAWHLRSYLSGMLLVTTLLTFLVVGSVILAYRLPVIERESRRDRQAEVGDVARRLELLLGTTQTRLELLEALVDDAAPEQAEELLAEGLRASQRYDAVYRLSADGHVLAAGFAGEPPAGLHGLAGRDLSGNSLFLALADGARVAWSGRYPALRTGAPVVAVALRDARGRVLIGEVSTRVLLQAVRMASGRAALPVWLLDRHGAVIVGPDDSQASGQDRIGAAALLQALPQGHAQEFVFEDRGQRHHAAIARSQALDWYFVGHEPQGWANPRVQRLLSYLGSAFAGCLLVVLLVAPFWAQRLTRPLQRIVERAASTTRGEVLDSGWPRGTVAEFNQLSSHLEQMAHALQERERKFTAIFNAAPVPMSVSDVASGYRMLDVNEAWCRELRRSRVQALGRTCVEIGLWTAGQRSALLAGMQGQRASGEAEMVRGDGEPIQAQVFAQRLVLAAQDLTLWAIVDMGPQRLVDQQLRELNQQLGERVARRTAALAASNAKLSATVEQLRTAQDGLVQREKMAALGSLVAGVAHELHTPLGNAVMAVSALADAVQRLDGQAAAGGLRRSDMQQALDTVVQGVDIAQRNLRRAADLVHSFKQVAVDRSSAQRRRFELGEVVHEMVVSLQPSLARTSYRTEVDVPARGLRLDSYPGALGQVLGNLIQNAVLHGFDGRAHGTVRITAGRDARADGDWIWLRVADDGRGIAPEHIARVFDPFMTTKAGSGGTGLGLHISHNAVAGLLGGTLAVSSTVGEGTVFELRLPASAPVHADEAHGLAPG